MQETLNENNDLNVSKKSYSLKFSLIFLFISVVLCIISVSEIVIFKQKSEAFTEITGKIIDYNYNDKSLAAIIVEYEVDGERYQLNSKKYVDIPSSVGSVISIKYNPTNPSDAIITYEQPGFLFIIISFVVLIIAIIKLISSIRKKYKKEKLIEEVQIEKKENVVATPVVQNNPNIKAIPDQQTLGQLRLPSTQAVEDNNDVSN